MEILQKALKLSPVVYVTRDLERAISLPSRYQNYHIITNDGPFAKQYTKTHKNVLAIKASEKLDTRELLAHPQTIAFVNRLSPPARGGAAAAVGGGGSQKIIVFKNTKQIETICAEHGWTLLNPPAELASRVEEKLSQLEWLGELRKFLPPHKIILCKDLASPPFQGGAAAAVGGGSPSTQAAVSQRVSQAQKTATSPALRGDLSLERRGGEFEPYIIQFNRAHTGSGTILIESKKQIADLEAKFPNREIRVTQFITGPAFTSNNVVWGKKVLTGNINYQITGLPPFTNQPFATIGNDWALPTKLLSNKQIKQFKQMATEIGKKLAKDGWKGLFGIDTILDEKTGQLYLIEINARQPASTTFESHLQSLPAAGTAAAVGGGLVTTFEAHLSALLGLSPIAYRLSPLTNGSQIIARVKNQELRIKNQGRLTNQLQALKLNVIPYNNTAPGSDWLRIQSKKEIMAGHNSFNKLGEKIKTAVETL